MTPYFLIILFIVLLQLPLRKFIREDFNYILAFIVLFLFAALRGNGDGDYFVYLSYSQFITSIGDVLNFNFPMEIGFRILAFLVNSLGLHEQMVIASMNIISLTCIYIFIKRYSPDKMFSVFLFLPLFFMFDMHAARTAVAIGISTLGFKYLLQNKLFKYVGVIFVASCFHQSAWILLIMYFFKRFKINNFVGIGTFIFVTIFSFFFSLNDILLRLFSILPFESLENRFIVYMNSLTYGYEFQLSDPRMILVTIIYFVSIFTLNKMDKKENLLINFAWINLILMVLLRENTIFITRIVSYFNVYTVITIPIILSKYKQHVFKKEYALHKLSLFYIYLIYIGGLVITSVEYKLFFL